MVICLETRRHKLNYHLILGKFNPKSLSSYGLELFSIRLVSILAMNARVTGTEKMISRTECDYSLVFRVLG